MNEIIVVFLLSLIAGLGTGLGGLIAVIRKPGARLYGFLMGITAGVMITLSFLELVNEAWELSGFVTATIGFGAGAIFMFVLDVTIPHVRFGVKEIPHSVASDEIDTPEPPRHGRHRFGQLRDRTPIEQGLYKSGILIAIGITIHNIPEGIAVGAGYMHTPTFGVFIALAILLHNIPEGLAVGVAFGAVAAGIGIEGIGAAVALAIGIGLQNLPEGTAVSVPLRGEGFSRVRSFWFGQLSAVVEPVPS